jgi:hypothetical protein
MKKKLLNSLTTCNSVLMGLRIYGSAVEFFDQTWRPDDVVKVK